MSNLEYFNKNLKDVIFNKTNLFGDGYDGLYRFGKVDYFDYIHVITTTYTYYGPNMLKDFKPSMFKLDSIVFNFKNAGWTINKEETRNSKLRNLGI